ncbi:hypothetical protein, partial [Phenylobacterium sp.]|uniref:hypothetical protein n=1 Tax=Phenylobacterium sp. TaxID=1871053 RepID=UPI0025CC2292
PSPPPPWGPTRAVGDQAQAQATRDAEQQKRGRGAEDPRRLAPVFSLPEENPPGRIEHEVW